MIVNRMRRWSVATKQFLLMFAVTLAIFAFLAASNYVQASKLFKSQMMDHAQTMTVRTNQFLDSYLDNGQNILLLLSTRSNYLEASREQELTEFLRSVAETNSTIVKTLYIVSSDGKVFSSSQVRYEVLGNPALPAIYQQAYQSYAAMVSQPYDSPLSGHTVAIARPVQNNHGRQIGVAVVELDLDKLYRRMSEISMVNQTFAILSDQGKLVLYDRSSDLLPSEPHSYMTVLPEEFIGKLTEISYGSGELAGPKGQLITFKSGQNRLGWNLVLLSEESYFFRNLSALLDTYVTAGIFMLLVLLAITFMLSRLLTRPIRLLALRMDQVRNLESVPLAPVRRYDEIGSLTRSFNSMMKRIQSLLARNKEMEERKKSLELKVLQSQIAPHFLYNTLATIGSLARQQRITEVNKTIRALVGVLEFTFDRVSEYVSVREELKGLELYMEIQKIRYGAGFRFICEVEEEALELPILKLTLQPLVENAVFHGILPKGGAEGEIRVRGEIRNGKLRFVVRDNGAGMEQSRLQGLLSSQGHSPLKERLTGIGVSNVHERIRLYFGHGFGLRIRSRKEIGTVIVITLPASLPESFCLTGNRLDTPNGER